MDTTITLQSLLTFVAIIVAIIIAWVVNKWLKQKRLDYEIYSDIALINIGEANLPDISVNYKNKKVSNLRIVILRLLNSGRQPIPATDFEEPIRFRVPKTCSILYAEVEQAIPRSLKIPFTIDERTIEFAPALLNPKDEFYLKVIVDGTGSPELERGRIIGVRNVRKVIRAVPLSWTSVFVQSGLLFALLAWLIFTLIYERRTAEAENDCTPLSFGELNFISLAIVLTIGLIVVSLTFRNLMLVRRKFLRFR
jgi:hypothetical protein